MSRISQATRARVYARDGNRCRRCGVSEDLTIDHVVPVSKGGSSRESNLQTLCVPCNQEKAATVPTLTRRQARRGRKRGRRNTFVHGPLVHTPACTPRYCFHECPVLLAVGRAGTRD